MLTIGSQGLYEWLVTDENLDLLQLCPEVVLGKYVAVTSVDSGQLVPTEKETAAGWQSRGKIAYSPKIENADELPREGWDEWYIFKNPTDLGTSYLQENIFEVPRGPGHLSVFVNYCFAPHHRAAGSQDKGLREARRAIRPALRPRLSDHHHVRVVCMHAI
jgi:hypothetical protein